RHHRRNEFKPADAGTYNFTHPFDSRRQAYISQSERNVIPRAAATKSRFRRCHRSEAHQKNDMADDKSKRDFRDRNRVSADEDYELEYFARENDVTIEQVRELIEANGNDREALIEAARVLRERK
ncbi:DUF3606 domain-containing protein, partial [Mesorhizobium sp.]